MASFTAACIQINSDNDLSGNIAKAIVLVKRAANKGAQFIALPENAFFMSATREEAVANAATMEAHPAVLAMQKLAAELKVWLLLGSVAVKGSVEGKLLNRSILINAEGQVVEYYDKIHLFDVTVVGDQQYLESENIIPGTKAVTAELPWGKLGMTICYDLRFPHLFRRLAHKGALFLSVPAAFTYKTGEAHWHSLLRARAIENTCFVIAPAQCGDHPRGRRTYGHSLIIDPWGKIIAEGSEGDEGVVTAQIDPFVVETTRQNLPSIHHDREFD